MVSLCALSQGDYREGYIITHSKDTVFGEVSFASAQKSYQFCDFKKGNNKVRYTPAQVQGYGFVNGRAYSSQIVEEAFVETLVLGELSLYKFEYAFYVKKGDTIHKLESIDKIIEVDGKRMVRKDQKWKGILSLLTSDCRKSIHAFRQLKFSERDLTKFVLIYNQCTGADFKDIKAGKAWSKISVGAMVGVNQSTLKTVNASVYSRKLDNTYHSTRPSLGVFLNASSPRITERLYVQPELHITKTVFSALKASEGYTILYYDKINIDLTTLSLPLTIHYTFPKRNHTFVFHTGGLMDKHLSVKNTMTSELVFNNTVETYEQNAFRSIKDQVGLVGGVGVTRTFGKFNGGLVFRYVRLSQLSNLESFSHSMNRFSVSLTISTK